MIDLVKIVGGVVIVLALVVAGVVLLGEPTAGGNSERYPTNKRVETIYVDDGTGQHYLSTTPCASLS